MSNNVLDYIYGVDNKIADKFASTEPNTVLDQIYGTKRSQKILIARDTYGNTEKDILREKARLNKTYDQQPTVEDELISDGILAVSDAKAEAAKVKTMPNIEISDEYASKHRRERLRNENILEQTRKGEIGTTQYKNAQYDSIRNKPTSMLERLANDIDDGYDDVVKYIFGQPQYKNKKEEEEARLADINLEVDADGNILQSRQSTMNDKPLEQLRDEVMNLKDDPDGDQILYYGRVDNPDGTHSYKIGLAGQDTFGRTQDEDRGKDITYLWAKRTKDAAKYEALFHGNKTLLKDRRFDVGYDPEQYGPGKSEIYNKDFLGIDGTVGLDKIKTLNMSTQSKMKELGIDVTGRYDARGMEASYKELEKAASIYGTSSDKYQELQSLIGNLEHTGKKNISLFDRGEDLIDRAEVGAAHLLTLGFIDREKLDKFFNVNYRQESEAQTREMYRKFENEDYVDSLISAVKLGPETLVDSAADMIALIMSGGSTLALKVGQKAALRFAEKKLVQQVAAIEAGGGILTDAAKTRMLGRLAQSGEARRIAAKAVDDIGLGAKITDALIPKYSHGFAAVSTEMTVDQAKQRMANGDDSILENLPGMFLSNYLLLGVDKLAITSELKGASKYMATMAKLLPEKASILAPVAKAIVGGAKGGITESGQEFIQSLGEAINTGYGTPEYEGKGIFDDAFIKQAITGALLGFGAGAITEGTTSAFKNASEAMAERKRIKFNEVDGVPTTDSEHEGVKEFYDLLGPSVDKDGKYSTDAHLNAFKDALDITGKSFDQFMEKFDDSSFIEDLNTHADSPALLKALYSHIQKATNLDNSQKNAYEQKIIDGIRKTYSGKLNVNNLNDSLPKFVEAISTVHPTIVPAILQEVILEKFEEIGQKYINETDGKNALVEQTAFLESLSMSLIDNKVAKESVDRTLEALVNDVEVQEYGKPEDILDGDPFFGSERKGSESSSNNNSNKENKARKHRPGISSNPVSALLMMPNKEGFKKVFEKLKNYRLGQDDKFTLKDVMDDVLWGHFGAKPTTTTESLLNALSNIEDKDILTQLLLAYSDLAIGGSKSAKVSHTVKMKATTNGIYFDTAGIDSRGSGSLSVYLNTAVKILGSNTTTENKQKGIDELIRLLGLFAVTKNTLNTDGSVAESLQKTAKRELEDIENLAQQLSKARSLISMEQSERNDLKSLGLRARYSITDNFFTDIGQQNANDDTDSTSEESNSGPQPEPSSNEDTSTEEDTSTDEDTSTSKNINVGTDTHAEETIFTLADVTNRTNAALAKFDAAMKAAKNKKQENIAEQQLFEDLKDIAKEDDTKSIKQYLPQHIFDALYVNNRNKHPGKHKGITSLLFNLYAVLTNRYDSVFMNVDRNKILGFAKAVGFIPIVLGNFRDVFTNKNIEDKSHLEALDSLLTDIALWIKTPVDDKLMKETSGFSDKAYLSVFLDEDNKFDNQILGIATQAVISALSRHTMELTGQGSDKDGNPVYSMSSSQFQATVQSIIKKALNSIAVDNKIDYSSDIKKLMAKSLAQYLTTQLINDGYLELTNEIITDDITGRDVTSQRLTYSMETTAYGRFKRVATGLRNLDIAITKNGKTLKETGHIHSTIELSDEYATTVSQLPPRQTFIRDTIDSLTNYGKKIVDWARNTPYNGTHISSKLKEVAPEVLLQLLGFDVRHINPDRIMGRLDMTWEEVRDMQGYSKEQVADEDALIDAYYSIIDGLGFTEEGLASNEGKQLDALNIVKSVNKAPDTDEAMYMQHAIGGSNRLHSSTSGVGSPQNIPFLRYLFNTKNNKAASIDITTDNAEFNKFKELMVETLEDFVSTEEKVEASTPKQKHEWFDTLDQEFAEGKHLTTELLQLVDFLFTHPEQMTREQAAYLHSKLPGLAKGKTLVAVYAYAQYKNALARGDKSFATNVQGGIDGIVSALGFASIETINLSNDKDAAEIFASVGVITEDLIRDLKAKGDLTPTQRKILEGEPTLADLKEHKLMTEDGYTRIGKVFYNSLRKSRRLSILEAIAGGKLLNPDGTVTKLGRTFAKDPFMQYIYGAQQNTTSLAASTLIVEALTEKVNTIYDPIQKETMSDKDIVTIESIRAGIEDIYILAGEAVPKGLDKNVRQFLEKHSEDLNKYLQDTLVKGIHESIDATNHQLVENNSALSTVAGLGLIIANAIAAVKTAKFSKEAGTGTYVSDHTQERILNLQKQFLFELGKDEGDTRQTRTIETKSKVDGELNPSEIPVTIEGKTHRLVFKDVKLQLVDKSGAVKVYWIHSNDAKVLAPLIELGYLQIFDNVITSPLTRQEVEWLLNVSYFNNVFEEQGDSTVFLQAKKHIDNIISPKGIAVLKDPKILAEIKDTINADKSFIGKMLKKMLGTSEKKDLNTMSTNLLISKLKAFSDKLEVMHKEAVKNRELLKSKTTSISQYGYNSPILIENGKIVAFLENGEEVTTLNGKDISKMTTPEIIKGLQKVIKTKVENAPDIEVSHSKKVNAPKIGKVETFDKAEAFNKTVIGKRTKIKVKEDNATSGTLTQKELGYTYENIGKEDNILSVARLKKMMTAIKQAVKTKVFITFDIETTYKGNSVNNFGNEIYDITFVNSDGTSFNIFYKPKNFDSFIETEKGNIKTDAYYQGAKAAERRMAELGQPKSSSEAASINETEATSLYVASKEELAQAIFNYLNSNGKRNVLNAFNGTTFDFPALQNLAIETGNTELLELLEEGTDYVDLMFAPNHFNQETLLNKVLGEEHKLKGGIAHTSLEDTTKLHQATIKIAEEPTLIDTMHGKKESTSVDAVKIIQDIYNRPIQEQNEDGDDVSTVLGTIDTARSILGSEYGSENQTTSTANKAEVIISGKAQAINATNIDDIFNSLLSRDDVTSFEKVYLKGLYNVLVKPIFMAGRQILLTQVNYLDGVAPGSALQRRSRGSITFDVPKMYGALIELEHKVHNANTSERSSARVFMHELLHFVFEPALLNLDIEHEFPEEYQILKKLYRQFKTKVRQGQKFGLTESQINYILEGKNESRDMFELISHIMESGDVAEHFDNLIDINNISTNRKLGSVSENKLVAFFENFFEKIIDFLIAHKEEAKVSDMLIEMGMRIQAVETSNKMGLLSKLGTQIRAAMDHMTYKARYNSSLTRLYDHVITTTGVVPTEGSNPFTLLNIDPINPLGAIMQEYLPSSAALRPYIDHSTTANKIARSLNTLSTDVSNLIIGKGKNKLTIDEDTELFQYLGMLDIKALVDKTKSEVEIANIIELMVEEKVLTSTITEIIGEIKDIVDTTYSYSGFIKKVDEATKRMVDTSMGIDNTSKYIHAKSITSEYGKLKTLQRNRLTELVDKLITLKAMDNRDLNPIFNGIGNKAATDKVYYNAIRQSLSIDREVDKMRANVRELSDVDSIQPKGLPAVVNDNTVILAPVLMTDSNIAMQEKLGNTLIKSVTAGSIEIGIYKSTKSKAENLMSGTIGLIDLAHKDTYSLRSILLANNFTQREVENMIINEVPAWTDRSISAKHVKNGIYEGTDLLIKISEEMKLEHYNVDKRMSTAVSHRRREIEEYNQYKKYNTEGLELFYTDYNKNIMKEPNSFVWIGEEATTRKLKGVYERIPYYMKLDLKNSYGSFSNGGKGMWVRKEALVQMFGIEGTSANGVLDDMGINNKTLRRMVRFTENGVIEIMSEFKQKVVQKLLDTITGNIVSNTMLELAKGRVNPIEIIKLTLKNFKEIIRLNQLDKELSKLKILRREHDKGSKGYNVINKQIVSKEKEQEDSYLYYLVKEGYNDIFIDDVNAVEANYMSDTEKMWYKFGEKHDNIKQLMDFLFINKGTTMNKWLNTTFMVSDIAAQATSDILDKKYLAQEIREEYKVLKASGKHGISFEEFRTNKRKDFSASRGQRLSEMTIMYHIANGNAAINYLDRLGVLPFYKYQTRIKRVLIDRAQRHGVGAFATTLFELSVENSANLTLAQTSFFNLYSNASFSMIDNGLSLTNPAFIDNLQWIIGQDSR